MVYAARGNRGRPPAVVPFARLIPHSAAKVRRAKSIFPTRSVRESPSLPGARSSFSPRRQPERGGTDRLDDHECSTARSPRPSSARKPVTRIA